MYTHASCFTLTIFFTWVALASGNSPSALRMDVLTSGLRQGDDLNIDCTYETPHMTNLDYLMSFSWLKDDVIIYDGRSAITYQESRYLIMTEPNSVGINSLLVVRNVTRNDEGRYSCVFDENGANLTSEVIRLHHPPSEGYPHCLFHVEDGVKREISNTGQVLELTCSSDGYPVVNLSWHVVSPGGSSHPIRGRQINESSLTRNTLRLVLNENINTWTFICKSNLPTDVSYQGECEIGPIFVANIAVTKEDVDVTPTLPEISSTSVLEVSTKGSTETVTEVTTKAAHDKTTPTSQLFIGQTTTVFTNSDENDKLGIVDHQNVVDHDQLHDINFSSGNSDNIDINHMISKPILPPDEPRSSIECECKITQDYLQLSLFVLIPVLLLSMVFNTFFCVRGFKPKSYPLQVDSHEVNDMAVFGNRRTETIMRNERETASNDYSLGEIYAAIDTREDPAQNNIDYQPRSDVVDDDYDDDDDYFDDDAMFGYSHAVYDEPPQEEAGNPRFYFDVPPVDAGAVLASEVLPAPAQYK